MKNLCPNCEYDLEIKHFAVWAATQWWNRLPWYRRLWKTLNGHQPNFCEHAFVILKNDVEEKGRKIKGTHYQFRRRISWTQEVCAKCGLIHGPRRDVLYGEWEQYISLSNPSW